MTTIPDQPAAPDRRPPLFLTYDEYSIMHKALQHYPTHTSSGLTALRDLLRLARRHRIAQVNGTQHDASRPWPHR